MLFKTLLDIPYGMANGRLLSLDGLRPEGNSEVALPFVLWLHGGWMLGFLEKHFQGKSGFNLTECTALMLGR
jgi:hypothetical protein